LAVDRMADEAVAQSADDIELLMGPLMTFIQEAQSLEEIGETIYDLYPTLDSTRFQELLTRAMLASGLTGYGTAEKSDK
jgi:phage gp29-like protein